MIGPLGPSQEIGNVTDMTAQIEREHLVYGDIVLTDRPLDAYRRTSCKVSHFVLTSCKVSHFVLISCKVIHFVLTSFKIRHFAFTSFKVLVYFKVRYFY